MLPSVKDFLEKYRGKRIFFEPLWGNNGDTLIKLGTLVALRRAKVVQVRRPDEADLILINGSGGMSPLWGGIRVLDAYSKKYPDIPLAVLPSSWNYNKSEMENLFKMRHSPCFLYARERYSYQLLQDLGYIPDVKIGLDHDMAFRLAESELIASLHRVGGLKHNLFVERKDRESVGDIQQELHRIMSMMRWIIPKKIRHALPDSVRLRLYDIFIPFERLLNTRRLGKMDVGSPLARRFIYILQRKHPEFKDLPIFSADISLKEVMSFSNFCLVIANAAVVFTTRLHVGILGALLGKIVYLKSGNWHKIRGVYEFSLKDNINVVWLP